MLKNRCVAIQSRELSVVMNDVWNVLDRVGRGESGENNIHLLMSVLEQLLCYDERHWRLKSLWVTATNETQLFHAVFHAGVSETRCCSTDFYTLW